MRAMNLLAAGAAAAVLSAFAVSNASADVSAPSAPVDPSAITYTISLPNYSVSNIDEVQLGSLTFIGQGNYPNDPAFTASSPGPTTISYDIPSFLYSVFGYVPGESFLLGVATNLAGDAAGQQHLVLFTNDAFANAAQGIAFGTLFPNTNEAALISDLETQTNPGDIFTFAGGDAVNGSGSVASIAFEPGQNFEAIAFSDGQIIGSGTSAFVSGAPEPSTWLLMIAGLGGVGLMLRRAKTTVTFRSKADAVA